jgi:hypothetical protein
MEKLEKLGALYFVLFAKLYRCVEIMEVGLKKTSDALGRKVNSSLSS